MQPMKRFESALRELADAEHCLFAAADFAAILPDAGQRLVLLSRAVKSGILRRICKGIYLYPLREYPAGRILFHAAARLRAEHFNYISLETALSDAGVLSQVPFQWITLMSSGRSHVVDCGEYGKIEFVHTAQRPEALRGELSYDPECRLWRASVQRALRDMRSTRRSLDLVNKEVLHEFV